MSESLVYGLHAVKKALQLSIDDCRCLYQAEGRNPRLQQVASLARQKGLRIEHKTRDELTALCGSAKHQGCVVALHGGAHRAVSLGELLQSISASDLFLVLDGVQDPHNLGACLRTADAAGVRAVVVPKDRAASLTPVVRKVAAGGAETVPLITVSNLSRALEELRQAGVWLVGTSGEAQRSLFDQELDGPLALVMGAEGEGLRRLTAQACDYLVHLPMRGQVESLNVSVATGICLYEINRRRQAVH